MLVSTLSRYHTNIFIHIKVCVIIKSPLACIFYTFRRVFMRFIPNLFTVEYRLPCLKHASWECNICMYVYQSAWADSLLCISFVASIILTVRDTYPTYILKHKHFYWWWVQTIPVTKQRQWKDTPWWNPLG